MELRIVQLAHSYCTVVAYTSRVGTLLKCAAVGENLAIEESQVVGARTSVEALVWVCGRRKLVDNGLRVLRSSQELVGSSLTAGERLRARQVVDKLSSASRTFMAFL